MRAESYTLPCVAGCARSPRRTRLREWKQGIYREFEKGGQAAVAEVIRLSAHISQVFGLPPIGGPGQI